MFLLLHPQGQESSVGHREAASIPLAILGSPPGNRPQPKGTLDFCSCSSQRLRLALDTTAFLLLWGGAWTVPLPSHSEPGDRHRRLRQSAVHFSEGSTAHSRQPWAPSRYSGRPLTFAPHGGLLIKKNRIFPTARQVLGQRRRLPSPDLGAKVRAGQGPGGRATGSTERSWQRAEN